MDTSNGNSAMSSEDAALLELSTNLNNLTNIVNSLIQLRQANTFRFLSKKSRNDLVFSMVKSAGDIEDSAKAAFKALKKDKRVRVPEEISDLLLLDNKEGMLSFASTFKGTSEPSDDSEE